MFDASGRRFRVTTSFQPAFGVRFANFQQFNTYSDIAHFGLRPLDCVDALFPVFARLRRPWSSLRRDSFGRNRSHAGARALLDTFQFRRERRATPPRQGSALKNFADQQMNLNGGEGFGDNLAADAKPEHRTAVARCLCLDAYQSGNAHFRILTLPFTRCDIHRSLRRGQQ